jgi:hypothetical protein
MFDIFTTHADGSLQHLMSVRCLTQAQEMACQLSCLVPGEYFGYFERTEDAIEPVSRLEGRIVDLPHTRYLYSDKWETSQ